VFHYIEKRRIYFAISGVILLLGLISGAFAWVKNGTPLQIGVDFRGGTRLEAAFAEPVSEESIRAAYSEFGIGNPAVTSLSGDDTRWQIRSEFLSQDDSTELEQILTRVVAPLIDEESTFQSVSPALGGEVSQAAAIALLVAAAIILLYIMFSFRQVANPFRFGMSAVLAMFHDLMVIFGFMALMGVVAGWEADALFLTATLTVAGFSLQDTIVVFDRIRENTRLRPGEKMERVVNRSVLETIHRSFATQLAAMFVLVAILLFGGASIRPFIAVLLVGLASGTYSSIFTAVPLLVAWEKGEFPFGLARQTAR